MLDDMLNPFAPTVSPPYANCNKKFAFLALAARNMPEAGGRISNAQTPIRNEATRPLPAGLCPDISWPFH
jgi:hypothetical protein